MQKKILFLSYHFPPELSAGATRSISLIKALARINRKQKIYIFCSTPNRYGTIIEKKLSKVDSELYFFENIIIKRFKVPYCGPSITGQTISYLFYFFQVIFAGLIIQPNIVLATSAKLMTGFTGALIAFLFRKKFYLDIRDTFTDNFFHIYRWRKRFFLTSFFLLIENFTIRKANSINLVSKGFTSAFTGWEEIITRKNISITYFSNGINKEFKENIKEKIKNSKKVPNKFKIVYCGNLGIGQNIYKLIENIYLKEDLLHYFKKNKVTFEIYGSGNEKKEIESIIDKNNVSNSISRGIIDYKGLINKEDIPDIYKNKTCLLLQISTYNSLSMVIPTKVFEYAATPYPIIFSAKGFCFEFISKISGTIPYDISKPESLIKALEKVKTVKIDSDQRNRFLKKYDSDTILKNYAKHISETY